jgi:CrcB protein
MFCYRALLSFLSLKTSLSQPVYLFLTVGLLGGFTTFSAFSVETFYLIDSEKYINAFFYVLTSVLGGLLAFLIGRHLVRLIL